MEHLPSYKLALRLIEILAAAAAHDVLLAMLPAQDDWAFITLIKGSTLTTYGWLQKMHNFVHQGAA